MLSVGNVFVDAAVLSDVGSVVNAAVVSDGLSVDIVAVRFNFAGAAVLPSGVSVHGRYCRGFSRGVGDGRCRGFCR